MSADVREFLSKNNKKKGKLWLNARKHWEFESINRNLSAAIDKLPWNKSAVTFKKGILCILSA